MVAKSVAPQNETMVETTTCVRYMVDSPRWFCK